MGTMPWERARQENGFLILRRIILTLVNSTFKNTFRVWWRLFEHINPQLSTSVYSRTGKCDELWPFQHRAIFAFNGQGSKIGCMGTVCSMPKPQKSLLARHRLAREQHRPCLSSIDTGDDKWNLYANIRKRKEWLSPNKRGICWKCSNFCTWHSIL